MGIPQRKVMRRPRFSSKPLFLPCFLQVLLRDEGDRGEGSQRTRDTTRDGTGPAEEKA
jgi:hypothetical protein